MIIESFGVQIELRVPSSIVGEIDPIIPPGATSLRRGTPLARFSIEDRQGRYVVEADGDEVIVSDDLPLCLAVLDPVIRQVIALNAPEHIFIHAGAVAVGGAGLLLPAISLSGKTTLVTEMVRAGAVYYSDEFAVLDRVGNVLPYARPLAIRTPLAEPPGRVRTTAEDLGGTAGEAPVPVKLIASLTFDPGAGYAVQARTTGEAALDLLANAVAARTRPAEVLSAVSTAAAGALAIAGTRGEAEETVEPLMRLMQS